MTDAPAETAASKASSRKRDLGARSVFGAELDLVVGSDQPARLRHAGADAIEHLGTRAAQLVGDMDVAGRDEDVDLAPCRGLERRRRDRHVRRDAARQGRDRRRPGRATDLARDAPHRIGLAGGCRRKACLDDVDPQPRELLRDAHLLVDRQRGARSLLPVTQRRVEDPDDAPHQATPSPGVASALGRSPSAHPSGARLRIDEGHVAAQRATDLLDGRPRVLGTQSLELGRTALALVDPAPGERPVLDLRQDPLHLGAGLLVDDAGAGHVVAVFGRVADRVAHVRQAALVHEVDDELELVHRLEVGELGLVAGLDERLEAGPHEGGGAAAEHGLLAEQVGLRLLGERRLEDSGSRGADPTGVGRASAARAVPVASRWTAKRAGTPPPPAYSRRTMWPGPFGATIPTSMPPGGSISPKWMLNPCANISSDPSRRFGSISA